MINKKKPKPLASLLNQFLKERGIKDKIDENKILAGYHDALPAPLNQGSQAIKLMDHVLWVKVKLPVVKQELGFRKSEVLERLQAQFGKKNIQDIKFI